MTKKDIRKVETIVKKILDDIIYEPDSLTLQEHDETMFSMALLQEMEAYLGHPIDFMGIS